ncbi:MAG: HmuY family protein, partial [Acidimicrobiia bacterium]
APEEEQWIRYTLDATSTDDWVFFDFEDGRVVDTDFVSPDWDVAFKRTKVLTNSGVTNESGPGGAFDLGEVPLEAATPPASAVFAVDVLGGDDDDEPENPALGRWYSYSFIKHIVSVKPNTYLVRTGGDNDALVQFDSYYCEDEEPGCITFRYRLVPEVADASFQL